MAQSVDKFELPISEITHNITLTVSGLGGFAFRFKIARMLFLLGAKIAGVNIKIED